MIHSKTYFNGGGKGSGEEKGGIRGDGATALEVTGSICCFTLGSISMVSLSHRVFSWEKIEHDDVPSKHLSPLHIDCVSKRDEEFTLYESLSLPDQVLDSLISHLNDS